MIEFEKACDLIFENCHTLETEKRLIEDAVGFALAEDIVSPINVAPFRNSAMDGFAVKSAWLDKCSADSPAVIPISSTSFAGNPASINNTDTHTLKVMTGARVPDEFDAVVPFEDTDYGENEVRFFKPTFQGKHIREPGEDITLGRKLFTKGMVLSRLDIGILATIGLRSVMTVRKPSMTILGTGDELTEPGNELIGDKIYDANTFAIYSLVSPFCGIADRICRVADTKEELEKALDSPHDVIVTSGGVSMGERDLVTKVAESCGWRRVFHKAKIKPGKPVYFAVRGKQLLFGLPGNPLSATVTCSIFLIPALKKMAGYADYRLATKPAVLSPDSVRKSKRKLIWPGLFNSDSGRTIASFSSQKSSAALTALQGTDGLIIQKATSGVTEDMTVETIPWSQILI
ncbi:MAG: molybdopterin molybdotransferase MoeA [candidate division Zixibacteria bacterium]|nr:molybdopterin molybdotransferase MoeA [candidate division Zixibacteria bacterium]